MTYLEAINEVLVLLRQDEVTEWNETTYSRLIGSFINKSKDHVERSWNWSMLRTTIRVTTTAGIIRYVLTGAGKSYKLLRTSQGSLDVYDDTNDSFLLKAPSAAWMTSRLNQNNVTAGRPEWFDFNGYNASGDPYVDLFPVPDTTPITINFNMLIPQEKLAASNTSILVPAQPIVWKAYEYAVRERGEDGGIGLAEIREAFNQSLSDEIAIDASRFEDELEVRVQ